MKPTIAPIDRHWLKVALMTTYQSKDPNTRVGAVIIGPSGDYISSACNELPEKLAHMESLMHDREAKLNAIVHAEMNALIKAHRAARPVVGATLYIAATDDSGQRWGGPPCCRCTAHLLPAGIARIVSFKQKLVSKWKADLDTARGWLSEAGIPLFEWWPVQLDGARGAE